MSDSDARNIPQVLRVPSPITPVAATQRFGSLIADPFGALWSSVADPVTGNPVGTIQLQQQAIPQDDYALVTASVAFGRNVQGNGDERIVDALQLDGVGTVAGNLVALDGLVGASTLVFADPVTGEFGTLAQRGALNADGQPATRVPLLTLSAQSAFNPASGLFDRLRAFTLGGNLAGASLNAALSSLSTLYLFDATNTTSASLRSMDTQVDAVAASASNWLRTAGVGFAFNGATFDRLGTASATNLAAQSGARAQLAANPGEWPLTSAPAANTQATATRAAGGAGVRHVLRSINASITATAAIVAPLTVVVRDGASGAGAILWQERLTAPAGQQDRVTISGLNIVGSANTAMTVEFTAVPGATNFETLSATGYSSA